MHCGLVPNNTLCSLCRAHKNNCQCSVGVSQTTHPFHSVGHTKSSFQYGHVPNSIHFEGHVKCYFTFLIIIVFIMDNIQSEVLRKLSCQKIKNRREKKSQAPSYRHLKRPSASILKSRKLIWWRVTVSSGLGFLLHTTSFKPLRGHLGMRSASTVTDFKPTTLWWTSCWWSCVSNPCC